MTDCLHCQINELVRAHLERDEPVDVADLVAKMVESVAELITEVAPAEEQTRVLAEAIRHLGHSYLDRSGAFGDEPASTH
jgi:hypothetical protein